MENKKKFKEFLTLIGEKFKVEVSNLMSRSIWEALKRFPDADCERAFSHVLTHGRFFKDLMPDLMEALQGKAEERATRAWLQVDKAVREIGPYASVRFVDVVIHSAIEAMGGWAVLGTIEEREWKWARKEFVTLYEAALRRDSHPEYLAGQFEINNRKTLRIDFVPEPVLIGQRQSTRELAELTKEGQP